MFVILPHLVIKFFVFYLNKTLHVHYSSKEFSFLIGLTFKFFSCHYDLKNLLILSGNPIFKKFKEIQFGDA